MLSASLNNVCMCVSVHVCVRACVCVCTGGGMWIILSEQSVHRYVVF